MRIETGRIFLACSLVLGVVHADAEDKDRSARSEERVAKTIVYAARNAPANLLGETLEQFLKEAGGRVVTDPISNVLLIQTATGEDHERVLAVLQQLDRTPRTIRVQLHLLKSQGEGLTAADVASLSGETDKVLNNIKEIQSAGRGFVANRMELAAIENNPTILQIGEDVPMVSGTTTIPGRGATSSFRTMSVGTMLKVQSRLSGDADIVMEVDFEKSEVTSPAGNSDEERQSAPQGVARLTHQATSRIHDGHSLLVGTLVSQSNDGSSQAYLVLSASIDAANQPSQATISKAFSQKQVPKSAAKPASGSADARKLDPRYLEYYAKLLAKYDQNNDKALDAEERTKMTKDCSEADTDKDGLVNVEELATWSMKR
jgi:hypothetical protein